MNWHQAVGATGWHLSKTATELFGHGVLRDPGIFMHLFLLLSLLAACPGCIASTFVGRTAPSLPLPPASWPSRCACWHSLTPLRRASTRWRSNAELSTLL